jgi:drug/metabolite transporter (DMT)-like permease
VNPSAERIGLFFAALCAINGAFVPAFAKLTTGLADPLLIAAGTTAFAGIVAAAVVTVRGEWHHLLRPPSALPLTVVGALGTSAAFVLFFAGAQRATAIDTVLCLQIEPAYSLLAAWLVLGHRPTRRRVGAIGLVLGGIALAVGAGTVSGSLGVWLLLATPLCWQLSHLIVLRRLGGVPPPVLTAARYIHGALQLALLWLLLGGPRTAPPAATWATLLPLLAVQGTLLSFVGTLFWYQAIARLDLARTTAIVVPSVPLLSLAASFALLGEVPSASQGIGLAVTAVGVLAFVTAPHATPVRERIPSQTAPIAATDSAPDPP